MRVLFIVFVFAISFAIVSGGGICKYQDFNKTTNAEKVEHDDCLAYATQNCRQKCISFNFDPNYSCKLANGFYTNCTLQCRCNYFSPDYKPTNVSNSTLKIPDQPRRLNPPNNECLLFGQSCISTCVDANQYCQVMLPFGPKSCVCHHWMRGNSLIGAFNDFLSIGESLYSNNGRYQLTVTDYWHLSVIRLSDEVVTSTVEGFPSETSSDRFTLKNDKTFIIQSGGVDFKEKILQDLILTYLQFEGSVILRMEDCGYAIFYNSEMKRVSILGKDFSLTHKLCTKIDDPEV